MGNTYKVELAIYSLRIEEMEETYHGIPTWSCCCTVMKLLKTPKIVELPTSMIKSQKFSWT